MASTNWSTQVSWDEACARSAGRRRHNAIRQMKARIRQQAILHRLRELGGLGRCGVQAQLAREFHVATSVISTDLKHLFARDHGHPGQTRPAPRQREVHMPEKISLRLSTGLYDDLQQEARAHGISLSDVVRLALQQVLDQSTPAGVSSTPPLGDAWELLLTACPPDVQQAIRQAVTATELPLGSVLKALIIAACQPKTTPQPSTSPETLRMTVPPAQGLCFNAI